jgi:hypothetical protein
MLRHGGKVRHEEPRGTKRQTEIESHRPVRQQATAFRMFWYLNGALSFFEQKNVYASLRLFCI